ncbi:unnamed protein product [Pleuronectes platessa]|uniref:Uncharacterized protein n=1 Tax=Pleuronectes platessa TaxID=8262 RepID=A0A9N7V1C0_PLEPL|nr:unnamed protein product [Pleuronectes platessa]
MRGARVPSDGPLSVPLFELPRLFHTGYSGEYVLVLLYITLADSTAWLSPSPAYSGRVAAVPAERNYYAGVAMLQKSSRIVENELLDTDTAEILIDFGSESRVIRPHSDSSRSMLFSLAGLILPPDANSLSFSYNRLEAVSAGHHSPSFLTSYLLHYASIESTQIMNLRSLSRKEGWTEASREDRHPDSEGHSAAHRVQLGA